MKIANILDTLNKVLSFAKIPIKAIPAALIACGAINRPGMSPMEIASNIIRRMSDAGIPNSEFTAVAEAMERIRAEENIRAIKLTARVESAIPPGAIQTVSPDGTISTNINTVPVNGIII